MESAPDLDVTSTDFRPDENMTVAQAHQAGGCSASAQVPEQVSLENGYPSWYSTYVDYAIDNDLIERAYGNYTAAQMNSAVTRAGICPYLPRGDGRPT